MVHCHVSLAEAKSPLSAPKKSSRSLAGNGWEAIWKSRRPMGWLSQKKASNRDGLPNIYDPGKSQWLPGKKRHVHRIKKWGCVGKIGCETRKNAMIPTKIKKENATRIIHKGFLAMQGIWLWLTCFNEAEVVMMMVYDGVCDECD